MVLTDPRRKSVVHAGSMGSSPNRQVNSMTVRCAAAAPAIQHLDDMLDRRTGGEPLQYVLGRWDFLGLDLLVDRRVLVPRPETEVVAQTAIEEAVRLGHRRGKHDGWLAADTSYVIADLGTGSGAIALTLARELPDAIVAPL